MARSKPRRSAAAEALSVLTPERRERDTIALVAAQIIDALGNIGHPYRVQSLLDRLLDCGDIELREWDAGERFAKLYRRAALHPLKAQDYARSVRHPSASDLPNSADRARRQRDEAMNALGGMSSPAGCCAWFVLGEEFSVREWALREGWGGKPIREDTAKKILLGALGVLADHFGL